MLNYKQPFGLAGRPPHGERGLKYVVVGQQLFLPPSPPARGAWIEIPVGRTCRHPIKSPPARGAWIEIVSAMSGTSCAASPPARGAWIEMWLSPPPTMVNVVAPRTGSVD